MIYYFVKYPYWRKINSRKKETPDNLKLFWTTFDEEFSSIDEAESFCRSEGHETYEIYKVELVKEAQE